MEACSVVEKVLAAVRVGPSKTELREYPMPMKRVMALLVQSISFELSAYVRISTSEPEIGLPASIAESGPSSLLTQSSTSRGLR